MIDDTRGVSEVLGFVLIFALITSMIAVVFTVGFAGLQSSQESEQVNNVERAFDVFDDNLKDLYQRDNFEDSEMSRATEIKLSGGSISFEESTEIRVEQGNFSTTYRPLAVAYTDDSDTTIVYEGGAVIRSDGGASVMQIEPNFQLDHDRSVFTIVNTRFRGDHESISSFGTILIVAEFRDTSVVSLDDQEQVNVTVESPRAVAWNRYFEKQEFGTVKEFDQQNETVTYSFTGTETTVIETRLGVRLSD